MKGDLPPSTKDGKGLTPVKSRIKPSVVLLFYDVCYFCSKHQTRMTSATAETTHVGGRYAVQGH